MSCHNILLTHSILTTRYGQRYHKRLVILSLLKITLENIESISIKLEGNDVAVTTQLHNAKRKLDVMTICLRFTDPQTNIQKLYSCTFKEDLFEDFLDYDNVCKCDEDNCLQELHSVERKCKRKLLNLYPDLESLKPGQHQQTQQIFSSTKQKMKELELFAAFKNNVLQPFDLKLSKLTMVMLKNSQIVDWKLAVNPEFIACKKRHLLNQLDWLDNFTTKRRKL